LATLLAIAGVVFGALRAQVEILTSRPSSIASLVKYAPHSHSMMATSTGQGAGLTPSES
jgi:hypothetical protein